MVVFQVNRNNYRLTSNDFGLNQEADKLMEVICFLSNERVYKDHFPLFSTIKYNGVDETELIEAIEDLERIYKKTDVLHQKAHLYVLMDDCKIYHNTECGTDLITTAPICKGDTPLEALKNAWEKWSIPPVLILNADYHVPDVNIHTVYSVPWNCEVEV